MHSCRRRAANYRRACGASGRAHPEFCRLHAHQEPSARSTPCCGLAERRGATNASTSSSTQMATTRAMIMWWWHYPLRPVSRARQPRQEASLIASASSLVGATRSWFLVAGAVPGRSLCSGSTPVGRGGGDADLTGGAVAVSRLGREDRLLPACVYPADASPPPSRTADARLGASRVANTSMYGALISFSGPVYPGAC